MLDPGPLPPNPLRQGSRLGRQPEPAAVVIFGASGDLAARKLVPALFSLASENRLPPQFRVIGVSRSLLEHAAYRERMRDAASRFSRYGVDHGDTWEAFAQQLTYQSGSFSEGDMYRAIDRQLAEAAAAQQIPDNRLYYLAAPPQNFGDIIRGLGDSGMAADSDRGWRRIIIEKPFGHDLASASALNTLLHQFFTEKQIYRIDHYLGKETVQNILVLRFANTIMEPLWNRTLVDHVQISVAESVGIGNRAGFYDQAGVVRDIFQNHLLQLLTLVAMEPPVLLDADAIRDEKVKVLRAMHPPTAEEVRLKTVRAQYAPGVIDGEAVPGYCQEPNVPADSRTPTYAAMRLNIDNWRWQGVPFYLRSGKRLAARATEVSLHFKQPPHLLFQAGTDGNNDLRPNVLALRIQPDEGITLRFEVKAPGQQMERRPVSMDFRYGASFGGVGLPEAYERLLLDAMLGDATLFARSDEIERAWMLMDPVLKAWEHDDLPALELYEAGTTGPESAVKLLAEDGRAWRRL